MSYTFYEIRDLPVIVETESGDHIHESTLKAWNILERVKDWIKRGVPGDVILELIEEMSVVGGIPQINVV